jgi:hypothetical protein
VNTLRQLNRLLAAARKEVSELEAAIEKEKANRRAARKAERLRGLVWSSQRVDVLRRYFPVHRDYRVTLNALNDLPGPAVKLEQMEERARALELRPPLVRLTAPFPYPRQGFSMLGGTLGRRVG